MPVLAAVASGATKLVTDSAKIVTDTVQRAKERAAGYQLGWQQNQIEYWGQQCRQNTDLIVAQTQGTSDVVSAAVGASIQNKGQKNKQLIMLSIVGISVVGIAVIMTLKKS